MNQVILSDALLPAAGRRSFQMARPAATVAEIVDAALPGASEEALELLRVVLVSGSSSWAVPRRYWSNVRPRAGTVVTIRVVPGDPVSISLALANIGGQIATAFYAATGIYVTVGYAGFVAIGAVGIGAAALAVGALAQSLIPTLPELGERRNPEDIYQIDGWNNRAVPGDAIPYPVGRIRMSPVYASRPYTEIIDGEQYQLALFVFGHGRLEISDVRIGDTPISEIDGIEIELREGTEADAPLTLITEQFLEETPSYTLDEETGEGRDYHVWTTPRGCDRTRLIFSFPNGFYKIDSNGNTDPVAVTLEIEYRETGTSTWSTPISLTIEKDSIDPFFRQVDFAFPSRGIWEVRVSRSDMAGSTTQRQKRTVWGAASGIRQNNPINYDKPLALAAVRAKASEVLNGRLDALNAVVHRYCDAWDGTQWVPDQLPRNAAATALDVLKSGAGAYPQTDDQIDLEAFGEWFEFCAPRNLAFNRVLNGEEDMGETLAAICAAGRATWKRDGNIWGVVIDRPQDEIVDRLNPRNVSSLSWSCSYIDEPPDAFLVRFRDETNGYEEAERVIPWPGFTGDPELVEDLPMRGVTDPAVVWTEARRRQYEVIHRPDTFTCIQSGAFRVATRGDAVALSWEMLDGVQVAARVVRTSGRLVVLDAPVTMAAGQSYGLRWQQYDETDVAGGMVEASVVTAEGEAQAVQLDEGSDVPPVGRLVHFGTVSQIDFLCRISRVEPAEDMAFRLTLINDGAIIDDLTDAEVPPVWDRAAGQIAATGGTPDTPTIGTISAGAPEYDYTGTTDLTVRVPVVVSSAVPVARIEVSHRINGSGDPFTVSSTPTTTGTVLLSYPRGTVIELYATAVSVFGDASADTATQTFDVSGGAVALPTAIDAQTLRGNGGLGVAEITLATQADTAELQLFRCPEGDSLDVEADQVAERRIATASSTITLVDGDGTRDDLISNGDFSTASIWTEGGGWSIVGGVAQHAAGMASTLSQSLTLTGGATYRGQVVVSGRTAGSITVQLAGATSAPLAAMDTDGLYLFEIEAEVGNDRIEVVATSDFDGAVDDVVLYRATATVAPQGAYDYYVAPITSQRVATVPTGPITVTII